MKCETCNGVGWRAVIIEGEPSLWPCDCTNANDKKCKQCQAQVSTAEDLMQFLMEEVKEWECEFIENDKTCLEYNTLPCEQCCHNSARTKFQEAFKKWKGEGV